jgi:hypothetical protein
VQEATSEVQGMVERTKLKEAEIADKWAKAMFENDQDGIKKAKEELAEWNSENPYTKIKINMAQIVKRVRAMKMTKEQRLLKSAPKEIRATARKELESIQ